MPIPTATIVVADDALQIGATSLVTITFSEAVTGFSNAGLTIENGTLSAVSSSDGGVTWTATFTPSSSISDATNVITLDNSGVETASGDFGVGTTLSNNYEIDTVRPHATGIAISDAMLKVGDTAEVTITFSEAVSDFTSADLDIANGTLSNVASSDGGVTWTGTLTPSAGISDTTNFITVDNTGVTDLAGNAGSGTMNSGNYAIDTARPTATIVVADDALAIGETSLVTITFSEAVSGLTSADLDIANGTLLNVASSDGGVTWTAALTPNAGISDTTNVITLDNTGVTDLAGNAGSGTTESGNYAIDTVRPTATSIAISDATLKAGETAAVTITFSEAVSDFTIADLDISNGTLSNLASSDGGATWTATLTPSAGISDTTNVITLDNTGVADLAGNAGSGTTDSSNYTINSIRPTATIVVADPTLGVGETSLVTITFSEAVGGFTNADLEIANGTLSNVASNDGGVTWTATLTPSAGISDTTNLITLDNTGVINAAGNTGVGTTDSNNYAVETVVAPPGPGPGPDPDPNTPTEGDDLIALPSTGGTVAAGEGADSVSGAGGDDFIHGNTGDDSLAGGAGDDIARGGQGADFVQGNTGDDLVFGDLGDDTAVGGQGFDFVQGNAGDDYVSGDLGNDTVLGGQGADVVLGGAGDDYVSGDLGDDTLIGGTGADLFNFSGGSGHDIITDFSRFEGDQIRISPGDAASFSALSITSQGADTLITLGAQTVLLVGVSAGSLTAADFVFA